MCSVIYGMYTHNLPADLTALTKCNVSIPAIILSNSFFCQNLVLEIKILHPPCEKNCKAKFSLKLTRLQTWV